MNAEVISIGSELMAGRIADTNAAYLSAALQHLGYVVRRHTAVDDRHDDILDALRQAAVRSSAAVVTGGLGPTPDDLTRQAMAELGGVPLREHPQAAAMLRDIFSRMGRTPSPSNFIQSCLPEGADLLPNPRGTAAGFAMTHGGCRFFVLPGVPGEMRGMFEQSVAPALRALLPRCACVRALQVYGVPESVIGERLAHRMGEQRNPEVATQAGHGVITVRVTATGTTEAEATACVAPVETEICTLFGDAVFDRNGRTLAEVTTELLARSGLTLACAESCTGGELTARLTDIPGASRFLLESAVAYSNAAKLRRLGVPEDVIARHGAVSAETAAAMAAGIRRTSGADLGLAITGIAGPDGATPEKPVGLVYLGLADEGSATVEEARFFGDRIQVRERAVQRALNMLRLYLLARKNDHG